MRPVLECRIVYRSDAVQNWHPTSQKTSKTTHELSFKTKSLLLPARRVYRIYSNKGPGGAAIHEI